MIHLAIGVLDIDWGKNDNFFDHSALFQVSDIMPIPHWYVDSETGNSDDWKIIAEYHNGLSAPLSRVLDRLKLLGYTLKTAEITYAILQSNFYYETKQEKYDSEVSFSDLEKAFAILEINAIKQDSNRIDNSRDKKLNSAITEAITKVRQGRPFTPWEYVGGLAEYNLDGYTLLTLFGLNQNALSLPVTWGYQPLIDSGWAKLDQFVKPLESNKRFLIVTEGSSDANILKHALKLLMPHVQDFFQFVDMNEGYPFTGTGSLVNFVKGLISISIQNDVIILFDNDAEGCASYNKCIKMNFPKNMKILKLPDLPQFTSFPTNGPNGDSQMDINGKAASIECYLDLAGMPVVQWKNYNSHVNSYQGELIAKQKYQTRFFEQTNPNGEYDFSKINEVLNMIITSCINLRESKLIEDLNFQLSINHADY